MRTIRALEKELLDAHSNKLHIYFAEDDGWVGEGKEHIIQALHSVNEPDRPAVKIVHGHRGIPHAFCISTSYNVFNVRVADF